MMQLSNSVHSRLREPEGSVSTLMEQWSIEVTPRTAAKIDDFRAILPKGTRVYIAHIGGTPIEDMVMTARRIHEQGFPVMPHFPARSIPNAATLEDWIFRYRKEADVKQALLLGGNNAKPDGAFESAIQLMQTGLFDRHGFNRLHIAGHPEGSRDIDKQGGTTNVDSALAWKQDFASRTDAEMAIVTQFAFVAGAVTNWAERIRDMGVTIPVHVGIAGPAKLKTLIQYAATCGVGASLQVLKKRAFDVTRLLMPYEPTDVVRDLLEYKSKNTDSLLEQLHVFPLGGIPAAVEWMKQHSAENERALVHYDRFNR